MKVKDVTGRRPDPELILNSLRTLTDIFEDIGVKYWMETGNLLGAVREGKLIPWDFDVDIGLQYYDDDGDIPSSIKKKLDERGFTTEFLGFKEADGVKSNNFLMAEKDGYAHIDIHMHKLPRYTDIIGAFLYYLPDIVRKSIIKYAHLTYFSNEKLRPTSSYERDVKLKRTRIVQHMMPLFFCYKVKKIQFYDFYVNIPIKAKDYLYLNYGKDWKIPKEKFVTYIG